MVISKLIIQSSSSFCIHSEIAFKVNTTEPHQREVNIDSDNGLVS